MSLFVSCRHVYRNENSITVRKIIRRFAVLPEYFLTSNEKAILSLKQLGTKHSILFPIHTAFYHGNGDEYSMTTNTTDLR